MVQNRSPAVMQQRLEPKDGLEDFPTPPWATRALIEEVIAPKKSVHPRGFDALDVLRCQTVWEPACGRGHMAATLGEYFFDVHASDVADYSEEEVRTPDYAGQARVADFLGHDAVPEHIATTGVDWIITNPPFRLAAEFVHRALALQPREGVAMIVRIAFLEGVDRHRTLFCPCPPTLIAQFAQRVPMVKGRLTEKGSTATAYCWLLWLGGAPARGPSLMWIPPCRKRLERKSDYQNSRQAGA